jgi:hypothetical protein
MKDTKPQPRKSTALPLREPAKPLVQPELKPPDPSHPASLIFREVLEAQAKSQSGTEFAPRSISEPPSISEPRADFTPHSISESRTKKTPPVQNVRGSENRPRSDSEPRRGYLQLTNHFIYDLMPTLKPSDSVVLLYLLARTHGWQKMRIEVALSTIATAVHISRSQARISLSALEARNHIRVVTKNGERGYVLDVLVPRSESAPPPESAPRPKYVPIKERDYKRTISKEVPPPSAEDVAEYERIRAELEEKAD